MKTSTRDIPTPTTALPYTGGRFAQQAAVRPPFELPTPLTASASVDHALYEEHGKNHRATGFQTSFPWRTSPQDVGRPRSVWAFDRRGGQFKRLIGCRFAHSASSPRVLPRIRLPDRGFLLRRVADNGSGAPPPDHSRGAQPRKDTPTEGEGDRDKGPWTSGMFSLGKPARPRLPVTSSLTAFLRIRGLRPLLSR